MSKQPKKTLKEYAEDAAARLKKSKNGTSQPTQEKTKSLKPQRPGKK